MELLPCGRCLQWGEDVLIYSHLELKPGTQVYAGTVPTTFDKSIVWLGDLIHGVSGDRDRQLGHSSPSGFHQI